MLEEADAGGVGDGDLAVELMEEEVAGGVVDQLAEGGGAVADAAERAVDEDADAGALVDGVVVEEVDAPHGAGAVDGDEAELAGGGDAVEGRPEEIVGEAVSGEGDVLGAGVPDGGVVFPAVDEVDIFRFEGAETDGFDSHRVCFFDCLECGLGSVLVKDDKSGYDTRHPAADGKE